MIDWFGRVPDFHDAHVLWIALGEDRAWRMALEVRRMTREVDEAGFFRSDRHGTVTFTLERPDAIDLRDLDLLGPRAPLGYVQRLTVAGTPQACTISWEGDGAYGTVSGRGARVSHAPARLG